MLKNRAIRALYVLLAAFVFLYSAWVPVQATRVFTDVSEGDWFNEYVLKAYRANLIGGYGDATFKPYRPVTKIEVIVSLAKLAGLENDRTNLDTYRQKYNSVMDSARIPVWAKDYVAYALEKGIVDEEELITFVKSDGSASNAKRYEVAVYFARTLGLQDEAKALGEVILPFKDNELISKWTRGYIKVLADRNIISGDNEGKFNPNDEITRAAIAKMLATSLDLVEEKEEETAALTEVKGRIEEVIKGTGRTVIKVSLDSGSTGIYDTAEEVSVKVDGMDATVDDIKAGQEATLKIRENQVVSVEATSKVEELEGVINQVLDLSSYSLIVVEDETGEKHTFRVADNANVKLDGSTAGLGQLKPGDKVLVTLANQNAVRIEAETKTRVYSGTFGGLETGDKGLKLILRQNRGETEYPVDDNADVERDGRDRGLNDLRKGDQVEITTEYGIVTKIVAESVDRELEGTIYSLLIARPHQLTILTEDGETESFVVPVDVDIEIDGKAAGIYDLRLDYRVEVKVESDEVVSIEATSIAAENEIIGVVEYVNTSVNVITVKVLDATTNSYTVKQVNVTDDTRIMDRDGDRKYLRHIEPGDRLVVVGHSELGVFIADTIMITNK